MSHANIQAGERVLIVGAGTIGVLAALSAKLQGAKVWLTDIAQDKLDYAAANFDIDGAFINSGDGFSQQVADITGGDGFDVAAEAVGLPSTFLNCIDAACYGGRVVQIGVGKKNADFNFTLLQRKELQVYGSRNALKKDFLALIDHMAAGSASDGVPLERVITNSYAWTDAPQAFADFDKNAGKMLKVVLEW
jgi:threonine dehydrogenase-like Zn-dependent dehydrogenase